MEIGKLLTDLGKGKYIVSYDPLDGSSVIDTNFSIGSIFAIWALDEKKLIGSKVSESLVSAVLVVYGPRTTALIYNDIEKAVQELTLVKKRWVLTENKLQITGDAKIFSPGNLRSASENKEYLEHVNKWISKGMTLRYTGGLVPDVNQIFIKGITFTTQETAFSWLWPARTTNQSSESCMRWRLLSSSWRRPVPRLLRETVSQPWTM